MPDLPAVLDLGAFGLLAYLVLSYFRRLDDSMKRSAEREERTALILAELTLQVARMNGAHPDETRESARIVREKVATV